MIKDGSIVRLKPECMLYPQLKKNRTYLVREVRFGNTLKLAGELAYFKAVNFDEVEKKHG